MIIASLLTVTSYPLQACSFPSMVKEAFSPFSTVSAALKKDFLKRLELSVKLRQLAGAQMEGQDFPTAQEMQEQTYEEARTEIDGMIAFLDSSLNDVSMTVYVDKEGCLASVKGTTS